MSNGSSKMMKKAQSPVRDLTRLNSKISDDSGKCPWRFLSLTGQSTLEYALVIAVVVAAIIAMGVYVRHSIQAHFKTLENRVNASVNKAHTPAEIDQPPEEPPEEPTGPGDGSEADPYKLNTLTETNLYTSSKFPTSAFSIYGNSTVYFEVDPYGYTGRSLPYFSFLIKGFDACENLVFSYYVVDKATGNILKPQTRIYQNRSMWIWQKEEDLDWDLDNVKYIFVMKNGGSTRVGTEVGWMPN